MLLHQSRRVRIGLLASLALLSVIASARGDDAPRNLAEMKAKYEADTEADRAKYKDIAEAHRPKALDEYWAMTRATAHRAFDYVRAHPDAPDSIDTITWTAEEMVGGYYPQYADEFAEAYKLLLDRGLDSDKVARATYYTYLVANACPEAKQFLEAALERSKSRVIRGTARLALARTDHQLANLARLVRDPIGGTQFVDRYSKLDPKYLAEIKAADADAADRRAEVMFEHVMAEYADVRMPQPNRQEPLGELAKGELYALRHLAVGKVAPDIVGEDVRGGPIRLGDYRGKVVAVVFWATWCGPCMGEVPNERKLVAKMAGRPFALIGIDGDDDREAAKKAISEQNMTWPSVWNGGMNGGIVADWGVRSWPTVYVLDGRGVIRYQTLRGELLERAVEHLVAEAEANQAK